MSSRRKRRRKKKQSFLESALVLAVMLGTVFLIMQVMSDADRLQRVSGAIEEFDRKKDSMLPVLVTGVLVLWAGIFLTSWGIKEGKKERLLNSSVADIDRFSGETFEKYLGYRFMEKGYKVRFTPKSGDFGADLILTKGREKIIVQAKRYKGKVGVEAVQQIVAAQKYYGDANTKMVVATNSYFTPAAKELAAKNHVTLWDRNYFFG